MAGQGNLAEYRQCNAKGPLTANGVLDTAGALGWTWFFDDSWDSAELFFDAFGKCGRSGKPDAAVRHSRAGGPGRGQGIGRHTLFQRLLGDPTDFFQ